MCRHLAWLGRPRTLGALVLEPPCGLLEQSHTPRRQRHGRMNADGWGVGYFAAATDPDGAAPAPARWRSTRPLWTDASFASVAPTIASGCVLAAVRSATAGMPVEESATAPFTDGRWLVSHNGVVDRAVLPRTASAESACDSALLAAHVLAQSPDRLAETVVQLAERDPGARLNLLLADGRRLLATTWGDTLSVLVTDDGVVLASEPYDDDSRWRDVADRRVVEVTSAGVSCTPLTPATRL